ncbi:RimK family alpha-L-glutamate ligase [Xanthobacter sp.]|uniref:RimK family alpha-L-glutamate ligase n=1 Tax=Xanthobacter sp. TaxID=35809 RepID=UPI0025F260CD|nr:RimK family alpha-L-glutamate ligase [Xanthobacter sp.]
MAGFVIFAERADWHTRSLVAALKARGVKPRIVSLRACGFAVGETAHGLLLPGFGDDLPDACFVRSVPAGTLEQITHRLGVLHALAALGVRVMNDARAIERCVDKSATTFLLAHAGLPTPRTLVLEEAATARMLVDSAPGDSVLKPLFGAQGRGLERIAPKGALPEPEAVGGVYYLQDFVAAPAQSGPDAIHEDFRVFVVGSRAEAAMARRAKGWITNIHQGATGAEVAAEGLLADYAVRAAAAVGASYAGVDLIRDAEGRLKVLEVNSMPAWHGLFDATGRNMAEPLAACLVGETVSA